MGEIRFVDTGETRGFPYLGVQENFCLICIKTYVVTLHLNHLDNMVQMRGSQHLF